MKFSSTLQFNAVPEWRDNYIDYDKLKELIFRLERSNVPTLQGDDDSLRGADPEETFANAVDKEVAKVDGFYKGIESQIFEDNSELEAKLVVYLEQEQYSDHPMRPVNSTRSRRSVPTSEAIGEDDGSDSSEDESTVPTRRKSTIHEELVRKRTISFENVSLRRELTRDFVQLHELLSYIELNREGVRKALKKFDKVTGTELLPVYMEKLRFVHVFADQTSFEIGKKTDHLVSCFAELVREPESKASEMLNGMLREHVVYERNTVWRELIGLERRAQGVQGVQGDNQAQSSQTSIRVVLQSVVWLFVAVTAFATILLVQPLNDPVQSRCLAVVVLASLLWSTEALPLFVTSLVVPVLVVVLRIPLGEDGAPMSAKEASVFVFAKMWSPVIAVLLGGFTLAAALSKYNLAKAFSQYITKRVGSDSPQIVILTLMFVAAFMCMWISNVAAPVLLFSVAQPLLRLLPSADPCAKALILGIALASNVGGMASPIASPQNILALQNMDPVPSWLEWFIVVIPVCVLSILVIWLWLCLTTPITVEAREIMHHVRTQGNTTSHKFTAVHYYILSVTVVTIGLWCLSHQLEPIVGDMGVLALVPIVLLFGPGVLSAADFNNFLWTIVALAMGGIVLGKSVESCGLLATVAHSIQSKVSGLPLFSITLIFGFMVLVVASFVSHTVAALIVLPLVKSIGEQLPDPHPRIIVMILALLCSAAMALPTSGFPNVTAVCMVDEIGKPYLTAFDFMSRGVPASVLCYIVVVTVGYFLCHLLGF